MPIDRFEPHVVDAAVEPRPEREGIEKQLDLLLASPHFRNSKRCQSLLKYVVEAYLEGALGKVKERVIGREVFHRDPHYDTNQDSVVRTTAADLRKRLAQYYLEPGHENEIRLTLPQGSYVPEFRIPVVVESEPEVEIPAEPKERTSRRMLATAAVVIVVSLAAAGWWFTHPRTELDRFWMPLLDDRTDAVICIEQPLRVFKFAGPRADEFNQKMVGAAGSPPVSAEVREQTSLKLSELSVAGDNYFTFGDLMASTRISELLAKKGRAFHVLGDRDTTYHDLRGKPAILLGQFNNKWTVGLTSDLRYYLDKNNANRTYEVRDRHHPEKIVASVKRATRPEEYAIVSRILDVSTEKTVIAVVGTTFFGTIAGADFLTNQQYMKEAFRNAPANWWHKNMQVVIRSTLVGGAPGPPKVVATHFW